VNHPQLQLYVGLCRQLKIGGDPKHRTHVMPGRTASAGLVPCTYLKTDGTTCGKSCYHGSCWRHAGCAAHRECTLCGRGTASASGFCAAPGPCRKAQRAAAIRAAKFAEKSAAPKIAHVAGLDALVDEILSELPVC